MIACACPLRTKLGSLGIETRTSRLRISHVLSIQSFTTSTGGYRDDMDETSMATRCHNLGEETMTWFQYRETRRSVEIVLYLM